MTLYAIKQLSTGLFLPQRIWNRGYSYMEPSADIPRLFTKERIAKIVLTNWLKGQCNMRWTQDYETGCMESDGPRYKPMAGRTKEDFAVVTVTLKEKYGLKSKPLRNHSSPVV